MTAAPCTLCQNGICEEFTAKRSGDVYVRCKNIDCGFFCAVDRFLEYEDLVDSEAVGAWYKGVDAPRCEHARTTTLKVSLSQKNPGRPYFACSQQNRCDFFTWANVSPEENEQREAARRRRQTEPDPRSRSRVRASSQQRGQRRVVAPEHEQQWRIGRRKTADICRYPRYGIPRVALVPKGLKWMVSPPPPPSVQPPPAPPRPAQVPPQPSPVPQSSSRSRFLSHHSPYSPSAPPPWIPSPPHYNPTCANGYTPVMNPDYIPKEPSYSPSEKLVIDDGDDAQRVDYGEDE